MRDGRVPNTISTGTSGNNYLTFSDSREGRDARSRLVAAKRHAPDGSSSSVKSKARPPTSRTGPSSCPEPVTLTDDLPTQPGPSQSGDFRCESTNNDALLSTSMLFFGRSQTVQNCYHYLGGRSGISDFLSLCMSIRCKQKRRY